MLSLLDLKRVVGHVGAPSANNYVLHLSVWETGTSIENNTSTVRYKMWITADNDKYITEYDGTQKYMSGWSVDGAQLRATIKLAGVQVAQTTAYYTLYWNRSWQNSAELIAEGVTSVKHNDDGNLDMSISATLEQLNNYASNPSNGSINTSGRLDYIARASKATLSASSVTANGSYIDITINKASSNFTSTLTWKYGNATDTLLNKSSAASARFTPNPATLYEQGLSGKVTFYLTTYSGNTQIGNTQTYEANLTIPAVSTIRATDANIGAVSQLTITRNSTAYTHSVSYAFSNLSAYIKADGGTQGTEVKYTDTSVGFAVPTTFYAKLPSANNGKVTVYVNTYYGNSKVGSTQSAEFTVYVTGSNPTITGVTIADQNATTIALTGDASKQVRYYSNTKISFTASAKNSASIAATSIGGVGTGATGSPSRTINAFEGGGVALGVTDSRGNGASATATPTMVNYVKLTSNHRVYRPQPTDGTARIVFSGDYWAGNFGAVANTLTLRYRWKPVGGSYSSWVNVTASVSGGKYTATVDLTGFDYQQAFQFNLSIVDKLITFNVEDTNALLREGETVFDWGKKDFNFNVPVEVNNNLIRVHGKSGSGSDIVVQSPDNPRSKINIAATSSGDIGLWDGGLNTWLLQRNINNNASIPFPLVVDGHSSAIGAMITGSGSASSVANGAWAHSIANMTVPRGVWEVVTWVQCTSAANVVYVVEVIALPKADNYVIPHRSETIQSGNGAAYPMSKTITQFSTATDQILYAHVYNSSGMALSFNVYMQAFRMS